MSERVSDEIDRICERIEAAEAQCARQVVFEAMTSLTQVMRIDLLTRIYGRGIAPSTTLHHVDDIFKGIEGERELNRWLRPIREGSRQE